jgi:hypothetical protein
MTSNFDFRTHSHSGMVPYHNGNMFSNYKAQVSYKKQIDNGVTTKDEFTYLVGNFKSANLANSWSTRAEALKKAICPNTSNTAYVTNDKVNIGEMKAWASLGTSAYFAFYNEQDVKIAEVTNPDTFDLAYLRSIPNIRSESFICLKNTYSFSNTKINIWISPEKIAGSRFDNIVDFMSSLLSKCSKKHIFVYNENGQRIADFSGEPTQLCDNNYYNSALHGDMTIVSFCE